MKTLLTAITLASSLLAAPAFAQDTMSMDEGLTMLEQLASKELTQNGITDVDVMGLSLNQIAQIHSVSISADVKENEKAQQLKQIVGK